MKFQDDEISEITKKLISFAHQLILDEVEKRACVSLPPDMQEFLEWLLDANLNSGNDVIMENLYFKSITFIFLSISRWKIIDVLPS